MVERILPALLFMVGAAGIALAQEDARPDETGGLLGERLRAHIEFLADDRLRGRQPGTAGYDIAANYVASVYRQLGLRPAGSGDSYFQPVPLRRAWLEPGSATMELRRAGTRTVFRFVDDFYRGPDRAHEESALEAPLLFVGYGIDAPELGHSDYAGVDAEGRIVVLLAGQPADFPSEEGAHFGSGREKMRAALARGAVGMVTVYTPRTERRYAWDRVRDRVGMPAMGWLDARGEVFGSPGELRGSAVVHYDAAGPLFAGAPHGIDELLAMDEAGEPLPVFALDGRLALAQRSRHEIISSPNVAAVLPGSDPLLAHEHLVYTAHLDHIGELAHDRSAHGDGDAQHGVADRINNGALDNASGVAVMLETARAMTAGPAPRRSVLFLAVTAEEKGLVGSEYFAQNPTVPVDSLVGVINLDMPVLLYDFADVIAFGAGRSTLGDAVDRAARESDLVLTPDPFPEQNIFVRSDHYRFVQRGIPSIFLVTGTRARDGETETLPLFEAFLAEHYHRPSDDLSLPIDYRAAARFTRVNQRIGEIVANDPERPRWREGDFFGKTFAAP